MIVVPQLYRVLILATLVSNRIRRSLLQRLKYRPTYSRLKEERCKVEGASGKCHNLWVNKTKNG